MSERVRLQDLTPPDRTQMLPDQVLEAGAEFLDHFNVSVDPANHPEKFSEAMDQLNPRFQGERSLVRYELEQDQSSWPDETKIVTMRAAENTRMMVQQTPFEGSFDMIIVLAGARQSNLDRMRYAARCLYTRASLQRETPEGHIKQGTFVVAGSNRELLTPEKENVANYARGAETEADLVTATVDAIEPEQQKLSREFSKYPQIMGYGAVIAEGTRVGTPQVLEAVLDEMQDWYDKTGREFPRNYRLGAITTQIYQVATELDVARTAKKYGITETFTAGNPSDPAIVAKRTLATYVSELSKTMKSAARAKAGGVDQVGLKDYPIRPYGLGDFYI